MSTDTPTPTDRRRRPIVKWAMIAFAALLGFILILLLSLRFAAQSGFGRNFVEARIEAADPSGQDIEIEGLSGDLLGTFRIERLTVADKDGIWLVAENVLADWKPLALRNRALWIEALEADRIHIIRQPALVPSNRKPSEGGSLPIRTGEIEKLRIGELRTDKGVLPRALSLAINGQGKIGRDGGRTELTVLPLEGDGDRLQADLIWSDDFKLQGGFLLDGPAGGLFASLARLEPGQAISANLDADGTLDTWKASGDVAIDRQTALDITASSEDAAIRFSVETRPGLHPLTAGLADTLGETLSADGVIRSQDGAPVIDVTMTAEGLQLAASGRREETGAYSADLRLAVNEPGRYARSDNVSVAEAVVNGNLVYQDGAARFDGTVDAANVDVPSFKASRISGPVIAIYDRSQVSVRTTLTGEKAVLQGMAGQIAGPAPILEANVQYDLANRVLSMRETTVRGRAGRVAAAGTLTFSPSLTADLVGSFQLDGAAAGLSTPIRANGQFQATRANAQTTRFETRINASNLGDLPAPLGDWSDGLALITARGELMTDNSLRLSAFSAQTGSLDIKGTGQVSPQQVLDADIDFSAGTAQVAGLNLASVQGSTTLKGPLDDLDFNVAASVPELSSGDFSFSEIAFNTAGSYTQGALRADATLAADTPNGPVAARSGFRLDGASWQVTGFEGNWGDLVAQADLTGEGGNVGELRGDLVILGDLPDGLPAGGIDASANIRGETLTLDATFETVVLGPTRANALVLRANGTPDDINFVIDMDGATELDNLSHDTSLDVDGNLTGLSMGDLDLTASVSAALGELALTTEEPVHFLMRDDGYEATASLLTLGGNLRSHLTTRGQTHIEIEGDGLRIAPILVLLGRPTLTGELDLAIDFLETDGGLAGPLTATLRSIARPESELGPVDLFIEGALSPDLLDLTVQAQDSNVLEANIELDIPVQTSRSAPFITLKDAAQIPFNARIDGQIEAISALVVPPQMVLKGFIDLTLTGTLPTLDQSFEGNLSFRDGVFEHGDLGMIMNQIGIDAGLGDGVVSLSSLKAVGRSGGTLTGSGSMSIDGSGQSDLELSANRLVITKRREGSATVSGKMQLVQRPDLLEVTGDLTVDEGLINIDKLPKGGPPTLDVSFESPDDVEEETEKEAATRLDINLSAPGRINVRGNGVNAELGLNAKVDGTMGDPSISGEMRIVRGRFDLVGKRFDFSDESSARLAADLGASRLAISATHETSDGILAILNVTGTISRPAIELTSQPELPEDEVLSRVLFGRSPAQLSGLEAARLAAALAQLSGGGGFDLVGGIGEALGLDTLDFGQNLAGAVEVTSGKYLAEGVYLEVRSGAVGAPGVAIEWEPIDNIEIEAATSADDGQELSIQWKRDFD